MTVDRGDLARYFRQLGDLGVTEVILDGMRADEAIDLLSRRPASGFAAAMRAALEASDGGTAVSTKSPESEDGRPAAEDIPAGSAGAGSALRVLSDRAAACTSCRLHEGRTTVVFGEGSASARLVVVGEAPGQEEDRTGRPFVGRAGKLLDLLLMTAGFPRDEVFICNTLKCRPPQNRNPLPDELAACAPFLHGQLDAIAPRVLVAVGKFAAQSLLESEESITRLRGRLHEYRGTPLVVTYHPAYLLRSPQMTRIAWQDFQLARRVLDEQARG